MENYSLSTTDPFLRARIEAARETVRETATDAIQTMPDGEERGRLQAAFIKSVMELQGVADSLGLTAEQAAHRRALLARLVSAILSMDEARGIVYGMTGSVITAADLTALREGGSPDSMKPLAWILRECAMILDSPEEWVEAVG